MYTINQNLTNWLQTSTAREKAIAAIEALKTLHVLRSGNTAATKEQQHALAKMPGWGTLAPVLQAGLDDSIGGYRADAVAQLQEILTPEEYKAASAATINAYHTEPAIAEAIWQVVRHLGFNGGKVLEPSAGTGMFIGTMPKELRERSEVTAVELDGITAEILQYLYPEAQVYNRGFERTDLLRDHFDLAISNYPFSDVPVASNDEFASLHLRLQNYCLVKSIACVRPGGLVVGITSKYTLDADGNRRLREYIGGTVNRELVADQFGIERYQDVADVSDAKARLIGAIRLPLGTFSKNANTDVSADIVIFQRLADGIEANPLEWIPTRKAHLSGQQVTINEFYVQDYWAKRRNQESLYLLGKPAINRLYGEAFTLEPDPENYPNLPQAVVKAGYSFECYIPPRPKTLNGQPTPPELQDAYRNSYCFWQDKVWRKSMGGSQVYPVVDECDRIHDFIRLRRVLNQLLDAQVSTQPDSVVDAYRSAVNGQYDAFVKRWGQVSSRTNRKVFEGDPNYVAVLALEKKDGSKADILIKRTCRAIATPKRAKSPEDALAISLAHRNCVDVEFMADLLKSTVAKVSGYLGKQGLIYLDPETDDWVTADEYLSGNVKEKLAIAQERGLERNVAALKDAQPMAALPNTSAEIKLLCAEALQVDVGKLSEDERHRLLQNTIDVGLGATWIPAEVIQQFIAQLIDVEGVKVSYAPHPVSTWVVSDDGKADRSPKNTETYGTSRRSALDLITRGLNFQPIDCYDRVQYGDSYRNVLNVEATEACRAKLETITQKFEQWLWSDKDRAVQLALIYNEKMNCFVPRKYDGSHLVYPGANEELLKAKPNRAYQNNVIWRILQEQVTHIPHPVGFGKTRSLCMGAMRLRQLGLAQKPVIVALKSTVPQIAQAFRELYPTASLLVADGKSFGKHKRQLFATQIATSDWDAVVVSHEQWNKLVMSPTYQAKYYEKIIKEVEDFIYETKNNKGDRVLIKALEAAKKRALTRLNKALNPDRKDEVISFEQLGIDAVFIDEFHLFKNLAYLTQRRNVAGLPNSDSQRSQDTYMKLRYLIENGKRVVTATGTPISNSMAEMFTQMRYHIPLLMWQSGMEHFDSFASTFIRFVSAAEITPTGKYKVKERPRSFVNSPEMMRKFRLFADLLPAETLNCIERPEAIHLTFSARPSEAQKRYMDLLSKRADAIQAKIVTPDVDNMLCVTGDGRKSCLDMRLVGIDDNQPDSKVNQCIYNVWKIWQATADFKGTQLVFCDFSTPQGNGFDEYNYARNTAIALGIPPEQIRFIHECDTDAKKEKLFDQVNSGEVRLLFGSTSKLGTGVNVQERLVAVHHLDAPWRPSDIEQREGRIERQGNLWPKVWIFRYVTEGKEGVAGFDSFLWQILETKATFIGQVMQGDDTIRTVDDISGEALNYASVKAAASGDPLIIEKAELDNEFRKLTVQLAAHENEQVSYRWRNKEAIALIDSYSGDNGYIAKLSRDLETIKTNGFSLNLQGKEYCQNENGEWLNDEHPGTALVTLKNALHKEGRIGTFQIGEIAGLQILMRVMQRGDGVIIVRGETLQEFSVHNSSYAALDKLKEAVANFEKNHQRAIAKLEEARASIQEYAQLIGQPFAKRDRLEWVRERLAEINAIFHEQEQAALLAQEEEGKSKDEESEEEFKFWLKPVSGISAAADPEIVQALRNQVYQPTWITQDGESVQYDWLGEIKQLARKMARSTEQDNKVIYFPGSKKFGIEAESQRSKLTQSS